MAKKILSAVCAVAMLVSMVFVASSALTQASLSLGFYSNEQTPAINPQLAPGDTFWVAIKLSDYVGEVGTLNQDKSSNDVVAAYDLHYTYDSKVFEPVLNGSDIVFQTGLVSDGQSDYGVSSQSGKINVAFDVNSAGRTWAIDKSALDAAGGELIRVEMKVKTQDVNNSSNFKMKIAAAELATASYKADGTQAAPNGTVALGNDYSANYAVNVYAPEPPVRLINAGDHFSAPCELKPGDKVWFPKNSIQVAIGGRTGSLITLGTSEWQFNGEYGQPWADPVGNGENWIYTIKEGMNILYAQHGWDNGNIFSEGAKVIVFQYDTNNPPKFPKTITLQAIPGGIEGGMYKLPSGVKAETGDIIQLPVQSPEFKIAGGVTVNAMNVATSRATNWTGGQQCHNAPGFSFTVKEGLNEIYCYGGYAHDPINQMVNLYGSDAFLMYSFNSGDVGEASADEQAAQAVSALITALPEAAQITLADKTTVDHANAEYNKLTTAQKALVQGYDKLASVSVKLAALVMTEENNQAAQPVIQMINNLPNSSAVTEGDRASIEAARAAYNALNGIAQQQFVTNIDKLNQCEVALRDLGGVSSQAASSEPASSQAASSQAASSQAASSQAASSQAASSQAASSQTASSQASAGTDDGTGTNPDTGDMSNMAAIALVLSAAAAGVVLTLKKKRVNA